MAKPTKKQKAYARWLLQSNYVPLEKGLRVQLHGRPTVQSGILLSVATTIVGRHQSHPQLQVAQAALLQLDIAASALAKEPEIDVPTGWPGAHQAAVADARRGTT